MLRTFALILFFVFLLPYTAVAEERPVLTMVYKDIGKPPYMQVKPDNSGLYLELMTRAVEKIGYELRIIRGPKKRTHYMLKHGLADLYPAAVFRVKRSEFLYYIPNGLYRHESYYGLTGKNIPDLNSISDIRNHKLVWIVELGCSWGEEADRYGVAYSEVKEITVDRALKMLIHKRPFFFRFIKEDLEKYMEANNLKSFEGKGVKLHKFCCHSNKGTLYVGFSRKSPLYSEQVNTAYDPEKPLSADNFPFELVPGSVPYRLKIALQEMIDSGEIASLAEKYFGEKWQDVLSKELVE
ncbi:hypothetical protein [Maridesulfovibrio hydrothermalis]|uniref:Solute-binding protein family 3/N-terminal domain-containing protein n=1 Tax=Maridesulfovibrio hydrothermalis AM13 = DSM 14728 TaxID=1121451 RepID=L0R932_9BACT|nr:hypothetical protein [Maridesulfovibrio hydrothermalis]CCO22695.1 conserved exported protein of unknown function [Maridesulfovibrio hydrothermalis AM13 = DSM 14728]